jgi:hypothetical protein
MPIEFRCSQCTRLLRTGDDTAGRMAQCPECGAHTQVPAQGAPGRPASDSQYGIGGSSDPGFRQTADYSGGQASYQAHTQPGPSPGGAANVSYALNRVSTPAVCLIVTAVLGLIMQLLGLLNNLFMIGLIRHAPQPNMPNMPNMPVMPEFLIAGPFALVSGIVAICLSVVVLIGAMKMKRLENYGFAMAASIIAMIPCFSPCCLLGLPIGIWAVIVLSDPAVKSSFKN